MPFTWQRPGRLRGTLTLLTSIRRTLSPAALAGRAAARTRAEARSMLRIVMESSRVTAGNDIPIPALAPKAGALTSRNGSEMFAHRLATPDDLPALQRLMTEAIRALLPEFLSPEKVEASFAVMGVDSQLIADGTYFVLEEDGVLAGCGGWSRRATL